MLRHKHIRDFRWIGALPDTAVESHDSRAALLV
jgi:hypothetical protein